MSHSVSEDSFDISDEVSLLITEVSEKKWVQAKKRIESCPPMINAEDADGKTPLYWAIASNNQPGVDFLLRRGAHPDIKSLIDAGIPDSGVTPLAVASAMGNMHIVNRLLQSGANPNITSEDEEGEFNGETPFLIAVRFGHVDIVKQLSLVSQDLSNEALSSRALLEASGKGHLAIVEFLLLEGLDVDRVCENEDDQLMHPLLEVAAASHGATNLWELIAVYLKLAAVSTQLNMLQEDEVPLSELFSEHFKRLLHYAKLIQFEEMQEVEKLQGWKSIAMACIDMSLFDDTLEWKVLVRAAMEGEVDLVQARLSDKKEGGYELPLDPFVFFESETRVPHPLKSVMEAANSETCTPDRMEALAQVYCMISPYIRPEMVLNEGVFKDRVDALLGQTDDGLAPMPGAWV